MIVLTICAVLAGVFAFGILAEPAAADHRKRYRKARINQQYSRGPDFVYGVPGLRVLFGDYALTEEEYDDLYGTDDSPDAVFDEDYYVPKAKSKTAVTKKPRAKPEQAKAEKPAAIKTEKTAKVSKPSQDVTTASVSKPEKADTAMQTATSGALSCDKAGDIVSGYGFQSVKPTACKGKTYAFAATRDGSSFSIKLDPASGELTEVKKLQ